MNHSELVTRAVRWLKNTKKCGVILHEWPSAALEFPDAIGWRHGWDSYLIECKASVSDFHADKKKSFRVNGESAGLYRYYMTPSGMLTANGVDRCVGWMKESLPGWGLIECRGRFYDIILESTRNDGRGSRHEIQFMYSAILRLHCGYPVSKLHTCPICDDESHTP